MVSILESNDGHSDFAVIKGGTVPVEAMWTSYFVRDRCGILGLNTNAQTRTRALELALRQGKR